MVAFRGGRVFFGGSVVVAGLFGVLLLRVGLFWEDWERPLQWKSRVVWGGSACLAGHGPGSIHGWAQSSLTNIYFEKFLLVSYSANTC